MKAPQQKLSQRALAAWNESWGTRNSNHYKKWIEERDRIRKRERTYRSARTKALPHVALGLNIKGKLRAWIRKPGCNHADAAILEILGCSRRFFRKWIESLFLPGMTFDNRTDWELDHIFPTTACGSNLDQIRLANHYRNIRPAWKTHNTIKGVVITEESLFAGYLCGLSEIHLIRNGQLSEELRQRAVRLGFTIFNETSTPS
jgi:hypothetical protein